MKQIIALLVFTFGISQLGTSQISGNACESTPCNAIPICDTSLIVNSYSYSSTGNPQGTCASNFFTNNWVYYRFTCYGTGNLMFSITPNDLSADMNWALWNITTTTCASLSNTTDCSATISAGTVTSPSISLTVGNTYILGIQRASGGTTTTGFSIAFTGTSASLNDTIPPSMSALIPFNVCQPVTKVKIKLSEPVRCSQLDAGDFSITNNPSFTVTASSCPGCVNATLPLINSSNYKDTISFNFIPALSPGTYTLSFNPSSSTLPTDICNQTPNTIPNITFTVPVPLSLSWNTHFNCTSQTYTDTLFGNNGQPPYQYRVKGGTQSNTYSSANIFTGLQGGVTYTLYVKDNNNCEDTSVVTHSTVIPLQSPDLTASASPLCHNLFCGANGDSIRAAPASSGQAPYNWTIASTPASALTGATFVMPSTWKCMSFTAGATFTVTVTDALGCTMSATKSLINPPQLLFQNVNVVHPVCPQDSSGQITAQASGGTGPWYYNFSPAFSSMSFLNSSASHIGNLASGVPASTYTISVMDSHACLAYTTVHVNLLGVTITDTTLTHCGPYTWPLNGNTYTSSGNYYYSYNCIQHILHLTIHPMPVVNAPNVSFCSGSVMLGGSPAGGTWNLPNPYSGGATTYTYYYTNANACSDSAVGNISYMSPISNIQTSNVTGVSALLSWSGNSSWYEIRMKPISSSNWNATVTSSLNNKPLNGLIPATTYTVEVRGFCNSSTYGAWSGTTFTTTNTCNVPTGLSVTNMTANTAKLKWLTVQGANYYKVRRRAVGSNTWIVGTTVTTSKVVAGLSPTTTYEFQVSANCGSPGGSVNTAYSSSFIWTTPVLKPIAVFESGEFENVIYPNPVTDILHMDIHSEENSELFVKWVDMTGRVKKLIKSSLTPGENHIDLDVHDLTPGMYSLLIFNGENIYLSKQILKQD